MMGIIWVLLKKMWEDIGDEFIDFVLNFFGKGEMLDGINMIWVILIFMMEGVKDFNDFVFIKLLLRCL